ncbi:hypothetical protein ABZ951_06095 [Streptomyces sp. NPDC046215]|uniref:Uncharacterized protein n=1 Tax=Streptomyces stramineus TaxID=173861 RepID=A0ABN1AFL9_9ACTN
MSFDRPSPYGPPPQQPTPYGQPYGQPYPPPPMPPMPPSPPGGGGKGKVVGTVVAVAVLVGALAGGGFLLLKKDGSAGDDGKRYQLITPGTVAGTYTRNFSDGEKTGFDEAELADVRRMGVANPRSTGAGYKSGSGVTAATLKFNGVWGEVKNPEAVVDGMFKSLAKATGNDSDGRPKSRAEGNPMKVSAPGLGNAVMKCQYISYLSSKTVTLPLCIWADSSTLGTVFVADSRSGFGVKIPFDEAGGLVAKLRADVRVEIEK